MWALRSQDDGFRYFLDVNDLAALGVQHGHPMAFPFPRHRIISYQMRLNCESRNPYQKHSVLRVFV